MVSQILSTVLDSRPLLWWWSSSVEALWVFVWSLIGGIIAWSFLKPLYLGVTVVVALFTLFVISFSIFILAGWIAFIPSVLGMLLTQIAIISWLKRKHFNKVIPN